MIVRRILAWIDSKVVEKRMARQFIDVCDEELDSRDLYGCMKGKDYA